MSLLSEGMARYQADVAALPDGVRLWMNVMRVSFFSGAVFMFHRPAARWVVGVMILTALTLFIGKGLWPDLEVHLLGGLNHILTWPIALWFAWAWRDRTTWRAEPRWAALAFRVWLIWASGLIAASLALDVRAVFGAI